MARERTQKAVAGRIDLNYHRRWHRWGLFRVSLVVLCTLGAAAWIGYASVRRAANGAWGLSDQIHNPGPVARAHAFIENKCNACHDGGSGDGKAYAEFAADKTGAGHPTTMPFSWSMSVSDKSCLVCHDGSLHHENQKMADAHASLATFQTAVADATHPSGKRSASCLSCHMEHRGDEALSARNDRICLDCHSSLDGKTAGDPDVQRQVTAFGIDSHPHFGRGSSLIAHEQPADSTQRSWSDRTKLKFGHLRHAGEIRGAMAATFGAAGGKADKEYLNSDCLTCHHATVPSTRTTDLMAVDKAKWESTPPPYAAPGDRDSSSIDAEDLRYMASVSFNRHCYACHMDDMKVAPYTASRKLPPTEDDDEPTLELASFSAYEVPHAELPAVRNAIKQAINKKLADMQGPMQIGALLAEPPPPAEDAEPAEPAEPSYEWFDTLIAGSVALTNAELEKMPDFKGVTVAAPAAGSMKTNEDRVDALADHITALAVVKTCFKCHEVSVEGVQPGSRPSAQLAANTLRTAPTLLPTAPRRWFPASNFDHYAHRVVDCRDCHAPAWTSGADGKSIDSTLDVLTVDIDGRYPGSPMTAASNQSCVKCHHADTKEMRGAPDDCLTCHWYHDQRLARPSSGATTQPAVMKAASSTQ